MECPILLELEAPVIKVYSLESIISEKFEFREVMKYIEEFSKFLLNFIISILQIIK